MATLSSITPIQSQFALAIYSRANVHINYLSHMNPPEITHSTTHHDLSVSPLSDWASNAGISMDIMQARLEDGQLDLSMMQLKSLVDQYEYHRKIFADMRTLFEQHNSLLIQARALLEAQKRGDGINSLPIELVERIFILSVDPFAEPSWQLSEVARGSFCIAQVNSHWRAIALAIPQLWSRVHIAFNTSREMLKSLFDRSKSCPLHLDVMLRFSELSEEVLSLLRGQADRVRAVSFDVDKIEVIRVITGMMSALEEIEWHPRYMPVLILGGRLFTLSPNLTLFRTPFEVILQPSSTTHNLNELEIGIKNLEHTPLTLLASYPRLRVATFHIRHDFQLPVQSITSATEVRAPQLTNLSILFPRTKDWNVLRSVMNCLYAPQLRELLLETSDIPLEEDVDDWRVDSGRPFGLASVTKLIVEHQGRKDWPIHYSRMLTVLAPFENIEHLELNNMRISSLLDQRALRREVHEQMFRKIRQLVLRDGYFGLMEPEHTWAQSFAHLASWKTGNLSAMVVQEPHKEPIRTAIQETVRRHGCQATWRGTGGDHWQIILGEKLSDM